MIKYKAKGFEKAMRISSTYSADGPAAKIAIRSKSFKSWMNTLGAEEQFPDVAPGNSDQAQKLLKYIHEEVLAKPESNPFPTFRSQGYWGDLNCLEHNKDGSVKYENGKPVLNLSPDMDYWHQAREYLYLWLQKKVNGKLMAIIGSGKNTSFLFDSSGILKYFKDNSGLLPEDRNQIPLILPTDTKYSQLKMDDLEVKATR